MIIHPARVETKGDQVILRARVDFDQTDVPMPDELWYALPRKYADYVTDFSDPFVAALFQFALLFDEPLQVEAPLSESLARNLPGIAATYAYAFPELYHPLQPIQAPTRPRTGTGPAIGLTFSGGFDSMYSLYTHVPPQQPDPDQQLTHLIFAHGFDMRLEETEALHLVLRHFQHMADELGLTLIPIHSNIYSFYEFRLGWGQAHHGPLIAFPLLFDDFFRRFYLSTANIGEYIPGAWYTTAPRYSHAGIEILEVEQALPRFTRIEAVKDWSVAWENLRICSNLVKDTQHLNCGHCDKCLPYSTYLEFSRAFAPFKTFPQPYRPLNVLRWAFTGSESLKRYPMITRSAREHRRWGYCLISLLGYLPARIKFAWHRYRHKIVTAIPLALRFRLKRMVFPANK